MLYKIAQIVLFIAAMIISWLFAGSPALLLLFAVSFGVSYYLMRGLFPTPKHNSFFQKSCVVIFFTMLFADTDIAFMAQPKNMALRACLVVFDLAFIAAFVHCLAVWKRNAEQQAPQTSDQVTSV